MAGASVRSSIRYLSDEPASSRDSQESLLVASSERHEAFSSTNTSSTSHQEMHILGPEILRSHLPETRTSSLEMEISPAEILPFAVAGGQDTEGSSNLADSSLLALVDVEEESNSTLGQNETRQIGQEDLIPDHLQQRYRQAMVRSLPEALGPLAAVPYQPDAEVLNSHQPQPSHQTMPCDSSEGEVAIRFKATRTG
jgi:hypothetical protein